MIQLPPMPVSDVRTIRSILDDATVRFSERRQKLPALIAKHEARLQELKAEQREVERLYDALIGDEEHGRPGIMAVVNEQLNLFDPQVPDSPKPSFSLGRRGHPAPQRSGTSTPIAAAPR